MPTDSYGTMCSSDTMCEDCGQALTVKEWLRWYIVNCQKRRNFFHDSRNLTPANKSGMKRTEMMTNPIIEPKDLPILDAPHKKVVEKVTKQCPECNLRIEASDIKKPWSQI